MTLTIGDEWINSDQCPQVAKAICGDGWVLSWRPGLFTKDEAVVAMIHAERGDLLIDPGGRHGPVTGRRWGPRPVTGREAARHARSARASGFPVRSLRRPWSVR
jgi:hypothetical protein